MTWIAILGDKSRIRQIDTPERILAFPVDEFVADFIGSGSTLKGLHFETVDTLELEPYPTMRVGDSPDVGFRALVADPRHDWLLLLDDQRRPIRWVSKEHLEAVEGTLDEQAGDEVAAKVEEGSTLFDTLEQMLISSAAVSVVVAHDGSFKGVVELRDLNRVIRRARREAREHYERLGAAS